MNHEHEQSRTGSTSAEFAHSHDDAVDPGQSSRSALLRKPNHAAASGLVQRKERDANGVADGAHEQVQRKAATSLGSVSIEAETPASEGEVADRGFVGAARQTPFAGEMGAAFGTDFSSVRAHFGPEATAACNSLGADAYTVGHDVAFASPSPDKFLVAHELAHVVQQSASGPGFATKRPGATGDHEAEADAAAAQVVAGEPVTTGLTAVGPSLARRRVIGNVTAEFYDPLPPPLLGRRPPHPDPGPHTTTVHTRNTAEWTSFLRDHADDQLGMLELCAFMAAATRSSFARWGLRVDSAVQAPTPEQAVQLMVALLQIGEDIDLADTGGENAIGESGGIFRDALNQMMSAFYGQYTAQALQRMTNDGSGAGRGFTRTDVENVAAMAEESADMGTGGVQSLIAGALGSAFGAATQILRAPNTPAGRDSVRSTFTLLQNSAMTIRGALNELETSAEQTRHVLMTIFNVAVAAVTGPLDGVVSSVVGALGVVAGTWFESFISGDPQEQVSDLKDKFRNTVASEGARLHTDPNTVSSLQSIFDNALNY